MRIRNWREYQHYDRNKSAPPPWIKFHRTILEDHEWASLSGDAAKVLVMLWLLAAEKDGQLPTSVPKLAFRLRVSEQSILKHLPALRHWVECPASELLASRYQVARPEAEAEAEAEVEAEAERAGARDTHAPPAGNNGSKRSFAPNVAMTEGERTQLVADHGEVNVSRAISMLDDYKGANGKRYKSDFRAIRSWVIKALRERGEYANPTGDPF